MSASINAWAAETAGDAPLSDVEIQNLLARAVQLYARRVEDGDQPLAAFPGNAQVTATEAMVAICAILKAVNLQVFELGMWQAWAGR